MPDPVLSVLLPAWNAAATIDGALDSILEDAPIDLEVLVIDDGSTDDTVAVVERRVAADARIRLLRMPVNVGVSAARNHGLSEARGTWLAFVDADDRYAPGALAALFRPTEDPTVRAVIGQRVWTDGIRTWIPRVSDPPDLREPGRKSLVTHPGLLYYVALTGKLFHRSLADGLTLEGRILGDQPWTIRALLRAGSDIVVVGETVYLWQRPVAGSGVATITTRKRDSAARAAEAAIVAQDAWRAVDAEARALLSPSDADRVSAAYLDRLASVDFTGAMRDLATRRDPTTAELFEALEGLIDAVPDRLVQAAPGIGSRLLRPPLGGYARLDRPARRAYWRFYDRVRGADPAIAGRISGHPAVRTALAVRGDGEVPWRHRLGEAMLLVGSQVARGRRAVVAARRRGGNDTGR